MHISAAREVERYSYRGRVSVHIVSLTKGSVNPIVPSPSLLGRPRFLRKLHRPGKCKRQGVGIIRAGFPALAHARLGFDNQLVTIVDVVAASGQLTGKLFVVEDRALLQSIFRAIPHIRPEICLMKIRRWTPEVDLVNIVESQCVQPFHNRRAEGRVHKHSCHALVRPAIRQDFRRDGDQH